MMDLLYRTDFLGHLIKVNILWSIYAIILIALVHVFIKETRNRYNYVWVIYISVLPVTLLSYYFDFFLIPFPQADRNFAFFDTASTSPSIDYLEWSIFLSIAIALFMYLIRLRKFVIGNQRLPLEFKLGKDLNPDLADLTIRVGSYDCSPYVYGILNPVVVLSEKVINSLKPDELEVILLHEKQHIIHKDYLKNMIQKCIRALFYYNPIVLFVDHYLDDLRESACDLDVIALKGGSKEYAQTLYLINEMVQQEVGGPTTVPFIRKTSQLKRRILRMRNVQKTDNKVSRLVITGLITVSTLFLACSDTSGLEEKESEAAVSVVELRKIEKAEYEKRKVAEKAKNAFYLKNENAVLDLHEDYADNDKNKFVEQSKKIQEMVNKAKREGRDLTSDERSKLMDLKGNLQFGKLKPVFEFREQNFSKDELHKIKEMKQVGKVKELKQFVEKRAAEKIIKNKEHMYKRIKEKNAKFGEGDSKKNLERKMKEEHKQRVQKEKELKKNQ